MRDFVGAIDQGTTSTRFFVFDHDARVVAHQQLEHSQLLPRPGWVEHDPLEILERVRTVMRAALAEARLTASDLAALGITNQRETTVVWDRLTGLPYTNAIVWQDVRTDRIVSRIEREGGAAVVRERTGLPPATYFSAAKIQWILQNVGAAREGAAAGTACSGTIDSWLLWNLTGGPKGGRHITDVTNASRTMLMDLGTLSWDGELLDMFAVPQHVLPEIRPSTGIFGDIFPEGTEKAAVPLTALLGDQHAAMIGQVCLSPGEAKNTYGTGNFLLVNTGSEIVRSKNGLLSTLCYQMEGRPAVYALEGSVAVTGAAVQWLRDQLGVISSASEVETLAAGVDGSGGVYFVPAFSGLFAPYWRSDARGTIVGLTRASTKAHLARATLEAICFQTRDVVLAMEDDLGRSLGTLKVDGGVTANELCMQAQADILGAPVSRPLIAETTALGAAYAAGCAVGFWSGEQELRRNWHEGRRWRPLWDSDRREDAYAGWKKAVGRALDWASPS
ncbi:MAG: glycerol kinase GlpK [Acidimicrobiales bacterium]